jgi:hypothetical protein
VNIHHAFANGILLNLEQYSPSIVSLLSPVVYLFILTAGNADMQVLAAPVTFLPLSSPHWHGRLLAVQAFGIGTLVDHG